MTLNSEAESSSEPIWPTRRRRDVESRCETVEGRLTWVLRDPLSLRFFYLEEEEYFVFSQLDGRVSPAELQRRLQRRFPGRTFHRREVEALIHALHRHGLLTDDADDRGERLWQARRKGARPWYRFNVGSLLSFRLGGVNPHRFLIGLEPFVRPLFHPVAVVLCLTIIGAAILLALTHADELARRLPGFDEFFAADRFGWLFVSFALTKCLHELGHGIALTHFGGACRRVGVMLLVFTPTLYCDVTDAWRVPERGKRALVSAAGMYVDLFVASICTFIWWFTVPGTLHYVCLNIMFLCSVGTILFNANPLLRFDGYYILSDLAGVPNLWQRSRSELSGWFARRLLGIRAYRESMSVWRRAALIGYALASIVYGWCMLFGIGLFIIHICSTWRLERLGYAAATALWVTGLFGPMVEMYRFLFGFGMSAMPSRKRSFVVLALGLIALAVVACVPWPYSVEADAEARPAEMQLVYVESPGFFRHPHVSQVVEVSEGELLTTLENSDVDLNVLRATARRDQARIQLRHLEVRRTSDPESQNRLPTAGAALADAERLVEQHERDRARLRLKAPCAGVVFPPPSVEDGDDAAESSGDNPWSELYVGRFLTAGTIYCRIGPRERYEALLRLDEKTASETAVGQPVRVKWEGRPSDVWEGTVIEIASQREGHGAEDNSARASGDDLAGRNAERPRESAYFARVRFDSTTGSIPIGARGKAKIRVESRSLASRVRRYLYDTFDFR